MRNASARGAKRALPAAGAGEGTKLSARGHPSSKKKKKFSALFIPCSWHRQGLRRSKQARTYFSSESSIKFVILPTVRRQLPVQRCSGVQSIPRSHLPPSLSPFFSGAAAQSRALSSAGNLHFIEIPTPGKSDKETARSSRKDQRVLQSYFKVTWNFGKWGCFFIKNNQKILKKKI